jgi:serine/threonine-protein kinase
VSDYFRPNELLAGKYLLDRPVARGGMGEVWLATHASLKTEVAVKFADGSVQADPDRSALILDRFLFEARISARLGARTKHIVAVLDAGTELGVPYLVMEYVRGRTLDEELTDKGVISPERMAQILDQVADALEVAHDLGVIHRDIKPGNVMLTEEQRRLLVKVTDFGVAKVVRPDLALERPRETPPNTIIGSPAYMSPEQMRSGNLPVDYRADLWSLGVLVYEALTGELPFNAKTVADLIVAISTLAPVPISKQKPALGSHFDGWLQRALAKDPAKRFQSARAMAFAFRSCIAASVRTSPRMWLLGGAIMMGIGVTLGTLIFSRTPDTSSNAPAPTLAPTLREDALAPPEEHPAPIVEPHAPIAPGPPIENERRHVVAPAPTVNSPAPTAAPTVEPSAAPTPQRTASPVVKPKRPPKEFDPSEIQ